ncbi:MAG: Verru_Chthon cassette protein A [Verrucomicrobiota bacterium]
MKASRDKGLSVGKRRGDRGVAIMTVLILMSLMVVLLTAIFAISTQEQKAAGRVVASARSRILTESPASLVISQIRTATENPETLWASQPGAIRTSKLDGFPLEIFKLYSAREMVVEDTREPLLDDLPEAWEEFPERFTDLNAPVTRREDGQLVLHFPILDPRAFSEDKETTVEGFSYSENALRGTVGPGAGEDSQRLPMPVAWLYLLEDGTLGTINEGGTFEGASTPTQENPIIGRIAFWTDDESCKINLNTAAEGSQWDTPRADTMQERELAKFQPVFGEYSRYPGHPASTSLSPVLAPGKRLDPKNSSELEIISQLHALNPRVEFGGSEAGTISREDGYEMPRAAEALYASVDELTFDPDRETTGFDPRQLRFFLTTSSRSPEVNLFGHPRLAMWPVHADVFASDNQSDFGTPSDELIAFCASAGGFPYFYQREFADDPIREFYQSAEGRNAEIFNWLKNLTSRQHPGYDAAFSDKYGEDEDSDRDQILAQILDYIRCTNLFDPHLEDPNRQYTGKQGSVGHGQVTGLTLMPRASYTFVWQDARRPVPKGIGRIMTISEAALLFHCNAEVANDGSIRGKSDNWPGEAGVAPVPGTKRIQVGLLLEAFSPSHGWTGLIPEGSLLIDGGGNDDFDPGAIPPPSFSVTPLDSSGVEIPGFSEILTIENRSVVLPNSNPKQDWITWGANAGPRIFMNNPVVWKDFLVPPETAGLMFEGNDAANPFRIVLYNTRPVLEGAAPAVSDIVQSFQLVFPNSPTVGFPVPDFVGEDNPELFDLESRLRGSITTPELLIDESNDVVRSIVPNHNDYRLVAAKRVIPPNLFVPHPDYSDFPRVPGDTVERMAHALTESADSSIHGATLENSLSWARFSGQVYPDFSVKPRPAGTTSYQNDRRSTADERRGTGDPRFNGEWDNGYASAPPGAYINRPDDGDSLGMGSGSGTPYFDDLDSTADPRANRRVSPTFYSPNKAVPSPGMLGSIPTGIRDNIPWETLLFRPEPTLASGQHYGVVSPPDHLFLDLFWMPVVEPYAISEPFSTAGKINMNYQILPFSHIRRATGMHAVLKNEKVFAIPTFDGATYKTITSDKDYRHPIKVEETLLQFEDKFNSMDFFQSASEICEIHMVPDDPNINTSLAMMTARSIFGGYWGRHLLTGDNSKERIYTTIYPRLTVRSNSFRVHYKVETIKKARSADADTFDPELDQITSSARGSTLIERFIDPNHPRLPDFATLSADDPTTLDQFYGFRILKETVFSP